MFTIEQSGHITKTNTIDGLINEYIKRYVDNYVIKGDSSNGNVGISNGNGITKEQLNEAVNGLRDYVINNYALSTDIPDDLINEESLTTKINEALKGYALKSEIPEPVDLTAYYTSAQADEKFVDEDELAYELDKYALKTDIPTIPTDLVNESALSTALYGTELNIEYPNPVRDYIFVKPYLPETDIHVIFDVNWGSNTDYINNIQHFDLIFKPYEKYMRGYRMMLDNGLSIVWYDRGEFMLCNSSGNTQWLINVIKAQIESPFIKTANVVDENPEQITIQCTQNESGCVVPDDDIRRVFTTKNIIVKFKRNADDASYEEVEYEYSLYKSLNMIYKSTSNELININYNTHIVSLRAEDETLTNIYDASITLISIRPVNDDMITSVKYVNDNFVLKSNVITEEQLIKKCAIDCGPITEGGEISIHYLKLEDKVIKLEYIVGDYALCLEIRILFYDMTGNPHNIVLVLHQRTVYFDNFKFPLYYEDTVDISSGRPLTYNFPIGGYSWTTTQELLDAKQIYSRCIMSRGYLAKFKAAIYGTQSNTTITHYSPIESSMNSVSDFVVGSPVYMTGKVYKHVGDEWKPSTADDTTDCICSVKTSGTWKEYVGICVRIDDKNKCITFASHGDYICKVNDSSCYSIGDEVFIDNEDNKLKVLSGETAITSKIKRMTVGIITSIIDERTLAVFKE